MSIIDKRVIYIGETVDQSLRDRLYQLHCSIEIPRQFGLSQSDMRKVLASDTLTRGGA
jgi:hypothetical protein